MIRYKSTLNAPAKKPRKTMTHAGITLWRRLEGRQLCQARFNRKKPVGPYIVDFYCHAANLVLEIDGGQHYQLNEQRRYIVRDRHMESPGLTVSRFSNNDVLQNLDGILGIIVGELKRK